MSDKDITTGGVGLAAYEPNPIPNDGPSMHDLVANHYDLYHTGYSRMSAEVLAVQKDLEDRKQFGLDKYGTLLQTNNGRDALVDAYQETLDLLVYMCQARLENKFVEEELVEVYCQTLGTAAKLRKLIGIRDG